jgi:hypothetical protein
MICLPYPDKFRRGFFNRTRAAASAPAALAAQRLSASVCSLRLAQPEEPMAVPVGAGHRFGDLGQAAEALAVPGKAFFQDHDALELALPFAHQQRAGLQGDPFAGVGVTTIERKGISSSLAIRLFSKEPPHRLNEIAESGDLQAVTQQLQEQPSRQMRRRFAAEVIAPLSANAFELETFEAGKDYRQRSVG